MRTTHACGKAPLGLLGVLDLPTDSDERWCAGRNVREGADILDGHFDGASVLVVTNGDFAVVGHGISLSVGFTVGGG